MARADTASASLRSDSIKGLAQSIAKPAYRRLLTAEPLLRRAVPVLIIAFMLTICIGAAVQVLEHRRQVVYEATRAIEALADHLATELDRPARDGRPRLARAADALEQALPAWAAGAGRRVLIADADGKITAGVPNEPLTLGRHILDVLGPSQPLTTFGAAAGAMEIMLADGETAFATVRALRNPVGLLAVIQSRGEALANWRSTTAPDKIYIEIFNWPTGAFHLENVPRTVTKAYLLAGSAHTPLKLTANGGGLDIQLPPQAPDPISSVLVLVTPK